MAPSANVPTVMSRAPSKVAFAVLVVWVTPHIGGNGSFAFWGGFNMEHISKESGQAGPSACGRSFGPVWPGVTRVSANTGPSRVSKWTLSLKRSASRDCIIKRIWSLVGLPGARASISNKSSWEKDRGNFALISAGRSLYAKATKAFTGKVAEKRPPAVFAFPVSSGNIVGGNLGLFVGFTEVTSNAIFPPAAACQSGSPGD